MVFGEKLFWTKKTAYLDLNAAIFKNWKIWFILCKTTLNSCFFFLFNVIFLARKKKGISSAWYTYLYNEQLLITHSGPYQLYYSRIVVYFSTNVIYIVRLYTYISPCFSQVYSLTVTRCFHVPFTFSTIILVTGNKAVSWKLQFLYNKYRNKQRAKVFWRGNCWL